MPRMWLIQVEIALLSCKTKKDMLAGALLLKELIVSAPKLFVEEVKHKPSMLEDFIQAIMKDKEHMYRFAGKLFLEAFLKVVDRELKPKWFRHLYDRARINIAKGCLEGRPRTAFL